MRILLTGNSPFCNTGYGKQPAQLALQLRALGHDVAIWAYFGLPAGNSMVVWHGIPVFPNPSEDYGVKYAEEVYRAFNADFMITLVDVWVLGQLPKTLKWFPWTPVDHEPMPPRVYKVLATHPGLYKPIAMSRFGQREMKRLGIDSLYVPHMIDCSVFQPDLELRKAQRAKAGWQDKFVIGKVGTNVRERKDWTAAFLALQKFARRHGDVVMYCHTDAFETRGRDLQLLRENLMLQDITFFPSRTELLLTGVSDITMNNMYNSLDVYLSNSKGEGFGIPAIEAQAAGVPVIVSNNTAQPELCGGGWILKELRPEFDEQSSWEGAANPDEIVDCLEQAYEEKQSGKLAERKIAAREKAMQYDIGPVMREHWIPTLDLIAKMAETPVERNEEKRAKLLAKIAKPSPEV